MATAEQLLSANEIEQIRFAFQGVDILGNPNRGYVYADDEAQAELKLTRAKIEVSTITPKQRRFARRRRTLTREELGAFAIQLAERTKSESIPQSIFAISRATNNALLRDALADVYRMIKTESVNIHEAFDQRADVFPEAFRHIIRVGAKKGDPSDMLIKYGERQKLTAKNLSKIRGSLIYPGVVLSVAGVLLVVISHVVVPGIKGMYDSLLTASGSKLPILTRGLIAVTDFLASWLGIFLTAAAVLVIIGAVKWLRTNNGKEWFQRHSIRFPLIGSLLRKFNAAHVIDLMSILAPLLTSQQFLHEASAASLNVVYRETLDAIREAQRDGALDLATAITPYADYFGDEFQAAVATGEDTGRLAQQLNGYAQLLDDQVEAETSRFAKLVEPLSFLVVGAVIGTIVIAVYWPLFQLAGDLASQTK
jgi:type II secretory pathway component PulF